MTIPTKRFPLLYTVTLACLLALTPKARAEGINYVVLGSSVGTWWSPEYARCLEEDIRTPVNRRPYITANQTISGLLADIRTNPSLREDLRTADVITVGVGMYNIRRLVSPTGPRRAGRQPNPIPAAMDGAFEQLRVSYDALLTEVQSLGSAGNATIRTMNLYCPYAGAYRKTGVTGKALPYWMRFNGCLAGVSRAHGIPMADIFAAFNGADGSADPAERGLIAGDGLHPSSEGMKLIAAEFRKLRYK